jgi:hypothetical protein
MPLDPRSSPQEVAAFLDAPLTERMLTDALRILRADPNWYVRAAMTSPTIYDLILLYRPAGAPPLTIRLKREQEHADVPTEPSVSMWRKDSPSEPAP